MAGGTKGRKTSVINIDILEREDSLVDFRESGKKGKDREKRGGGPGWNRFAGIKR